MFKYLLHVLFVLLCTTPVHAKSYSTETYSIEYSARTSTGTISFKDVEDHETLIISWNESDLHRPYLEVHVYPSKFIADDECEHTAQLHPATQVPVLEFSSLRKHDNTLSARYSTPYVQLGRIAQWCKYQSYDNAVFLYIDDAYTTTIPIKNIWYVGDMILEYLDTFKGGN